jgi:hypothetical protein
MSREIGVRIAECGVRSGAEDGEDWRRRRRGMEAWMVMVCGGG